MIFLYPINILSYHEVLPSADTAVLGTDILLGVLDRLYDNRDIPGIA